MTTAYLMWIFFPMAITLHNLEEAIWLPKWSQRVGRFHKPVAPNEFYFTVLCVTVLAYLSTFLAIAFPSIWLWKFIFFGFLGTMILNIFVPHLAATILLRRYAPGLLTGLFGLIPINTIILAQAIANGDIQWAELALATLIVGIVLLALLPLFFWIGRRLAT
ncbi:MAG: HXXEE domain-containing protein [Anaerolineae bacterium]|nr:HXXEE domain-containing protein [Anaerolineae bacterium]